jgi:hypothetical protein
MNGNGSILNLAPKVMILCVDMPSPCAHLGILDTGSQFDGTAVVLEDMTMKMRCCRLQSTSPLLHYLDQLMSGSTLRVAVEIAKYSASVVDNAISVCNLEAQTTGHDA